MGTRGTLKVYLNGELKIRQYNQWDSNPTGQFQKICRFFRNKERVAEFVDRLKDIKLATQEFRDEFKKVSEPDIVKRNELTYDKLWCAVLFDRDIGADILDIVASSPDALKILPDWKDPEEEDLPGEEGNYVIRIKWTKENAKIFVNENDVYFELSGEYHGCEKEYAENFVPTDNEIKNWEDEADEE